MKENKISIILTTFNSEKTIKNLLLSLSKQTRKDFELIVVDQSTDNTIEIIKNTTFNKKLIKVKNTERSHNRNLGAQKSNNEILLFIDSDMYLSKKLIEEIELLMKDNKKNSLVIPEFSIGKGIWSKCKILEKKIYSSEIKMSAARVYRKKHFFDINGYNEDLVGVEDFELSERYSFHYEGCNIKTKNFIIHDELEISFWRSCKKKFYYGQMMTKGKLSSLSHKKLINRSNLIYRYILYYKNKKFFKKNKTIFCLSIIFKTVEIISGGFGYLLGKIGFFIYKSEDLYEKK